jgi:hypothetical protein
MSASAMKPVTDTELAQITGKAGVSIFVDITMNISIDTIAWGDSDGLAPGPYNPWGIDAAGGYVGVSNFRISNLSVRSCPVTSTPFWPGPVTIDVYNGIPYYHIHVDPPGF